MVKCGKYLRKNSGINGEKNCAKKLRQKNSKKKFAKNLQNKFPKLFQNCGKIFEKHCTKIVHNSVKNSAKNVGLKSVIIVKL